MTDREQVIKGLECCASMNGSACRKCPYTSECATCEATYQTGTAHLAADALALLKEQEAVEPIRDDDGYYRCRSCNAYVAFPNGDCKKSFCEKCGKAVKWNE